MAEGSRPPGAEAEAPAHASGSTSPSPKHSSWLANEVLKRSCEVYFECLIKDFDKGRPGDYFVMSSSGIEVRDFEVVQETLVALMEGNCPIANVRVGDCRIKVPATVGLAKNTNPVHVSIQSLELDILAFPDMMPKARVQEIMARLMGQGDDDDNDTARFDAFRHSVKHNAKIKASWQFAALDVLEGPHALAAMLVLVTASLVTTILMMVYDYDTSRSRGRAIVVFDSIAFAIFVLEISARMWCYRHVHSRLFPQFCKDPFNIVDLGVIGIDVVLYLAKSHGSGFTRLAKSLRALKIARFARAARVLRKLHELREKNLAKQQYSLATKIVDGLVVEIDRITMHMLQPTQASMEKWLGLPPASAAAGPRPSEHGPHHHHHHHHHQHHPQQQQQQPGARRWDLHRWASMKDALHHDVDEKHRKLSSDQLYRVSSSDDSDRSKQFDEFPMRQIIEIKGLKLSNVDPSFTNEVPRLSLSTMDCLIEGSSDPGKRIFKRLAVHSLAIHQIDERAMLTPVMREMELNAHAILTRRRHDGLLVNLDLELALPSTIAMILADFTTMTPVTVRVVPQGVTGTGETTSALSSMADSIRRAREHCESMVRDSHPHLNMLHARHRVVHMSREGDEAIAAGHELVKLLREVEEHVAPFSNAREEEQWLARAANLARINLLYKSIATVIGDDPERWDTLFDLFDDNLDRTLQYGELQHLLEGCGIHFDDDEFTTIAQAIDADGDGEVDINEFKSYFQRDSEGQQDEPDDVEVKFIDDGASPQGINLQVSKHLSAFSGLTSCFDADEFPHSPEVHPFDRINTTLADQSESNKSSRTAMMKKMNNQSFYSRMEQAGRDAASDLIKRIADPVLELLLSGYDPSAEDTKARAAAACNDDKWERMVEFTERGLEIRQVSLDQSTLVALAGGQLAFGNVRLGRCLVAVPSIQSLLSSTLLGSVSEPVRVTVESVDIDQLPFPDVALPSEVEKILAKFQALGKQAQNQADAASAGDTPLAAASKHAKKSRKSSFTEQSVVSVQEQQEAVKSEHMRVASEYGPISRLIDGVEIEIGVLRLHMIDPTPASVEETATKQLARRHGEAVEPAPLQPNASMDGSNEGVLKWIGNLTRFSSSYDLEAAESEPSSPGLDGAGASKMVLELQQFRVANVTEDFKSVVHDLGGFTTSARVQVPGDDGAERVSAIIAHKKITIASLMLGHVEAHRSRTPMLRPVPLEAHLKLTRRVADCSVLGIDLELRLAARLTMLLAGLPESTRMRMTLGRPRVARDDDVKLWMQQSIAAARAAATWHMLHNWVKGEGEVGDSAGSSIAKLESLFQELDVDESGALDYDEFKELLRRHEIVLSQSAFDSLMAHIDADGDRTIDREEFFAHFRKDTRPA